VQPELDRPANGADQAGEDEAQGNSLRHVWRVDRGEGEPVVAQLAEFFLAVPEPLNKAVLVDELDGTGAYTGVEEGPL